MMRAHSSGFQMDQSGVTLNEEEERKKGTDGELEMSDPRDEGGLVV